MSQRHSLPLLTISSRFLLSVRQKDGAYAAALPPLPADHLSSVCFGIIAVIVSHERGTVHAPRDFAAANLTRCTSVALSTLHHTIKSISRQKYIALNTKRETA